MQADLEFYKLSGAGNDFIALVEPPTLDLPSLAERLCRRGISVGADGLFVLERTEDTALEATVRMTHFNADGGKADLCLNGTRCAAALVFHLGWGTSWAHARNGDQQVRLETGAGHISASATSNGIRTQVPRPSTPVEQHFARDDGTTVQGYVCDSGVPHLVRLLDQQSWSVLDLDAEGSWLRHHPRLGATGANVNFVLAGEASSSPTRIRTFERGVEGETLACGTGAVASAATLIARGSKPHLSFATQGGFVLEVSVHDDLWFLEGDARLVMQGTLEAGAFAL